MGFQLNWRPGALWAVEKMHGAAISNRFEILPSGDSENQVQ